MSLKEEGSEECCLCGLTVVKVNRLKDDDCVVVQSEEETGLLKEGG